MPRISKGIVYVSQKNMTPTGLDFTAQRIFVKRGSSWDKKRFRLKYRDILIARSGVASVGRTEIFREKTEAVVECFVDIIRQDVLNPYYITNFMKSKYGRGQIERLISGVGTVNINFNQIKSIQIPVLPDSIQKGIEKEYKKMSQRHDKAMEVKRKLIDGGMSNKKAEMDAAYQRNIKKAEAMLKDLIKKTEEIIEGNRKEL
jgi:type I restriction enzyme S subunit